jgi:hypothetical protein
MDGTGGWWKYGGQNANIVLDVGDAGSWDAKGVFDPAVVKEGITYQMWYTGYDGMTRRIGHATSPNGIDWTKDPASPVLDIGAPANWDWLNVYSPSPVKVGARAQLWYSGQTLPAALQSGYAERSTAGWSRGGLVLPTGGAGAFDARGAEDVSVLIDGDKFAVWYSGVNAAGDVSIGRATVEVCQGAGLPVNPVYLPVTRRSEPPACAASYVDGFENPASGWPAGGNESRAFGYLQGKYAIALKEAYLALAVTPGAKATDFAAAVSAAWTPEGEGAYGIQFGFDEDWGQFYEFAVEGNDYSIWKFDRGRWTALQERTVSPSIRTKTDPNRLKVVRAAESISVYVNDQRLATVTDGSFTGLRRVGLVAYSPGNRGAEARFDDFALYPAACGPGATFAGARFEIAAPATREVPWRAAVGKGP